jgi:flagellar biosynthesis protein FlhF
MQIKRFEAKTMTAALKMVKDEFGADAVILSARTLRQNAGFFGRARASGVEVTAAKDSGWPVYNAAGRISGERAEPALPPEAAERPPRRGLLQSLNDSLRSLTQRSPATAPGALPPAPSTELARLHHHLLAQELAGDLAGELIEQIQRRPGFDPLLEGSELRSQAAAVLQDMGLRQAMDAPGRGAPRVLVLVGPRGVGKTTLAIKLAALKAGQKGGQVALVTLDGHRVGAVVQLGIFGSILKVPVAVATSGAGARQKLQAFHAKDWLIVDTPGISPGESQRMAELQQILKPLNGREVHLVLSGCTREKDLSRMIDFWKDFPVARLAFTRLDETGACGHLLNLLLRTGLPLSYVATGPRIPEDLAEHPLGLLLRRVWQVRPDGDENRGLGLALAGGEAPRGPGERRVAPLGSESYHRADCKVVRHIKPEHLILFASAAEAESRRFVACRKCRPQESDRAAVGAAAWGAVRAAGGR